MKSPVTGLVFAGGQSRRMGTDKALMEWKGQPLWKIAADKLDQSCTEVILLRGGRDLRAPYTMLGDSPLAKGPLAGLIAGMEAAENEEVMALGCDMPLIPSAFLQAMRENFAPEAQVLIPEQDGQEHYLCSLWRKSALPHLQHAGREGEYALKKIVHKLSVQFVAADLIFEALPKGAFLNINTPADWETLQKLAQNDH